MQSQLCMSCATPAKPEPLADRVCAYSKCNNTFTPAYDRNLCCCEAHGKRRHKEANKHLRKDAWTDARRDAYHRRKAILKGASTGRPVLLSVIAARDANTCGLCGVAVDLALKWPDPMSKSIDHIVPITRGGAHDPDNAQLAHLYCNTAKGNRVAA